MPGTATTTVARLFSDKEVPEKDDPQVVRLPSSLWERLTKIAKLENEAAMAVNESAAHISRNDVIKKVLREFADGYETDEVPHERKHPKHKG